MGEIIDFPSRKRGHANQQTRQDDRLAKLWKCGLPVVQDINPLRLLQEIRDTLANLEALEISIRKKHRDGFTNDDMGALNRQACELLSEADKTINRAWEYLHHSQDQGRGIFQMIEELTDELTCYRYSNTRSVPHTYYQ